MKYLRRINEQDQPLCDNEDWRTICDDPKKVDDLINRGGDINYRNFLPIRMCCRGDWESREEYGEGYYDSFIILCKNGAKLDSEEDGLKNFALKWSSEFGRINFIKVLVNDFGVKKGFVSALSWLKFSLKVPDAQKERVKNVLIGYARKYEPELLEQFNNFE